MLRRAIAVIVLAALLMVPMMGVASAGTANCFELLGMRHCLY
jgi:hypothetical protein